MQRNEKLVKLMNVIDFIHRSRELRGLTKDSTVVTTLHYSEDAIEDMGGKDVVYHALITAGLSGKAKIIVTFSATDAPIRQHEVLYNIEP